MKYPVHLETSKLYYNNYTRVVKYDMKLDTLNRKFFSIYRVIRKNKQKSTTSLINTIQCTFTQYNVH